LSVKHVNNVVSTLPLLDDMRLAEDDEILLGIFYDQHAGYIQSIDTRWSMVDAQHSHMHVGRRMHVNRKNLPE